MKYNYDDSLGKRILKFILIFAVYFILSTVLTGIISNFLYLDGIMGNLIYMLITAIVSILFTLVFLYFVKGQRQILTTLTSSFEGNNKSIVCFCAILAFVGYIVYLIVPVVTGAISLQFNPSNIGLLVVSILVILLSALSEELDNRVFLFQNLRMAFHAPVVAIVISALYFAICHGVAADILGLIYYILGAIVFLLIVYKLKSTWGAYAYHIVWNLLALIFGEWDEAIGVFQMVSRSSSSLDIIMGGYIPGIIINIILILVILSYAKKSN